MKKIFFYLIILLPIFTTNYCFAQSYAKNPIIFADVPDMSMIRVGDSYYASSTTVHMSPGVPIMKSKDLVNWKIINYAYDTLANNDQQSLVNGKNAYGKGSWASSIRFNKGVFYVSTFSKTTGKTYIYSTKDIEKGPWKTVSFKSLFYDHSLFFDDDGKVYIIHEPFKIKLTELNEDASEVKSTIQEKVIIENLFESSGAKVGNTAEGSQLFKINNKYYLFNIVWPKNGMRTVIVHRADKITGPYKGRVVLEDMGVAQGGLIETTKGDWYSYLFRDFGSVGRIPYLVPVIWEDGWPVLGENGKVPDILNLPTSKGLISNIVASDEFKRKKGERPLPLVWQWNHNPDNELWSLIDRKGYLRLKTGRIDTEFTQARNTLTQRTIGPKSTAITLIDVSKIKEGDFAGLALLQKRFGLVGVKFENGQKFIVVENAESGKPIEQERIPISQNKIYLKAECDFADLKDVAYFFYSFNGKTWKPIGKQLKMTYLTAHFIGYRFGLFNYATQNTGGYVDFDFYDIKNEISK